MVDLDDASPDDLNGDQESGGLSIDCWDASAVNGGEDRKGKGKRNGGGRKGSSAPPRPWSPMHFVEAVDTVILKELTALGMLLPVVVTAKGG